MERPELNKNISLADFNDFYWLKQELIDFCKILEISVSGGKIEIADRIREFIQSGKVVKKESFKNKSNYDWSKEVLTRQTLITDNYKNGENVRSFFIQEIGPHFHFNIIFMKWMKDNVGRTLGEAINEWNVINSLKKDKDYVSTIDPQFEYNSYMRAFLADNPNLSNKEAMLFWKLKKAKRGTNEYQRSDLNLN